MEEKTYEELTNEFESLSKEYEGMWNDCAKRGLSYDDMLEETKDIRGRIQNISQLMRLKQEPSITYKRKKGGNKYSIEDFIDMVNDGVLIDYDGYGVYASDKGVSDIEIYPSDIKNNMYRKDFTHVIWYNR